MQLFEDGHLPMVARQLAGFRFPISNQQLISKENRWNLHVSTLVNVVVVSRVVVQIDCLGRICPFLHCILLYRFSLSNVPVWNSPMISI
jgi:hypothetical protein